MTPPGSAPIAGAPRPGLSSAVWSLASAGPFDLFGTTVGFHRGLVLLLFPLLAVLVVGVLWRRGSGLPDDRERAAVILSRSLIVALLVLSAAGPFTVTIETRAAEPSVTLLEDRSASTAVTPSVGDEIEQAIESRGVRVDRAVIASGNESRLGDGILANARANGSVLVLSDGRVTGGRGLLEVGSVLSTLNATVNSVVLEPAVTELAVAVRGPGTTTVDVPNRYEIDVDGVAPPDAADGAIDGTLVVSVDGKTVRELDVDTTSANTTVEYNFTERGEHTVTARLRIDDRFGVNDVFRKTVTVVEKPDLLYVARQEFHLRGYLEELYNVTRRSSVPADLSAYDAVVGQDLEASAIGNVTALQSAVLEGKGLVLVGGNNSFDEGGYRGTVLERMSPVSIGDSGDRRSRIVLLIDVSNSGYEAHQFKKALAANVVDQLGEEDLVGVIAFDDNTYRISPMGPLGEKRASLREKILRIDNGFATDIPEGLRRASQMLGGEPGTVVMFSDGVDSAGSADAKEIAEHLGEVQAGVLSVAVGNETDEGLLRAVADRSGGQFLEPDETERLRLLLGDDEGSFSAPALTILDDEHFITRGLRLDARLEHTNAVTTKRGADYLVSTTTGSPALTAWRYGVGRVAAVTAYGSGGGIGELLSRPDSAGVTRTVNWVIGEPPGRDDARARVPDTRVGSPTTVTYTGDDRPSAQNLSFVRTASGQYEATLRPPATGFASLLGADYAVNAPAEYAAFGASERLRALVSQTGGERFRPEATAEIARAVVEQTRHPRPVRSDWAWTLAGAGLALLAIEVLVRRLRRFRGRGSLP